jgi:pimeloyl-ACP methyl ester carboxylesterase
MKKNLWYGGKKLEYEVRGTGMPVMLVHGFTEDHRIWGPVIQGIENKYRWILPDLPGSGGSEPNQDLPELKDFAGVLDAILASENIQQTVLIGHSMGGYISLAFAEKYPEKILALGLFHSTSYPDPSEKKETRKKSMDFIRKNGAYAYVETAIPGLFSEGFKEKYPEEIQKLVDRYANFTPESLVQYLEAMKNRPATTGVLESITKPVLFIMGEGDKSVPFKDVLEQCHIPQISYIHILTHSAHMGMIEETSLCNSLIDRFLEQIPL